MLFKRSRKAAPQPVCTDGLRHIAFIMDGNGRWAKKRNMPREFGHREGAKTFHRIVSYCFDVGIPHVTVYAFSSENWARPEREVNAIMALLEEYLAEASAKFSDRDIRFVFLGDKSRLSDSLREKMECLERQTEKCHNVLNVAVNYGGRDELLQVYRRLLAEGKTDITAEDVSAHLYTRYSPDPDLIVRTGGDYRISNFLLWQSAYAEYYFTPTLWPDLTEKELGEAVADFTGRHRRFGGL